MNLQSIFSLMKKKGMPYFEGTNNEFGFVLYFSEQSLGKGEGVEIDFIANNISIYKKDKHIVDLTFSEDTEVFGLLDFNL